MHIIEKLESILIVENGTGFLEGNSVLFRVYTAFFLSPFEC